MKNAIHKETFSQPSHDGIPFHVVVQYYEDGELCAAYFENYNDAEDFERELNDIK